eukprot:926805-Amphidinium_carterae.1
MHELGGSFVVHCCTLRGMGVRFWFSVWNWLDFAIVAAWLVDQETQSLVQQERHSLGLTILSPLSALSAVLLQIFALHGAAPV